MVGRVTPGDPRRPQNAPWPAAADSNGIIGFFFQPSDDGRFAVVEFIARTRSALQSVLNDKTIQVFEEGRQSKATIEAAIKPYRRDFDLSKFQVVMP